MATQRPGENSENRLMLAIFGRRARAEPGKDRDQPDRIDRDKKRNKREQKFLEIMRLHRHSLSRRAHVRKDAILLYRLQHYTIFVPQLCRL